MANHGNPQKVATKWRQKLGSFWQSEYRDPMVTEHWQAILEEP